MLEILGMLGRRKDPTLTVTVCYARITDVITKLSEPVCVFFYIGSGLRCVC